MLGKQGAFPVFMTRGAEVGQPSFHFLQCHFTFFNVVCLSLVTQPMQRAGTQQKACRLHPIR